jgi:hypothetical protein
MEAQAAQQPYGIFRAAAMPDAATDRRGQKSGADNKKATPKGGFFRQVARWTGLEPATPGVTGRYSNQLSYHRALASLRLTPSQRWAVLRKGLGGVKRGNRFFFNFMHQGLE